MWFFLIKSIVGAILGQATNSWFKKTKMGVWFYAKVDLIIDFLDKPKVFKIAISFVLFFISIVNPETILNAATIIINERIINITFLSTLSALKRDLLRSDQV